MISEHEEIGEKAGCKIIKVSKMDKN